MAWGNFGFAGARRAESGLEGTDVQGRARALFGGMINKKAEEGGFNQSTDIQRQDSNPFQMKPFTGNTMSFFSGDAAAGNLPSQGSVAQSTVLRAGGAAEAPQNMVDAGMPSAPAASQEAAPQQALTSMNRSDGPSGLDIEELLSILRGRAPGQWDPERRSVVQTKPSVEEQASFAARPDQVMLNAVKNMWRAG